MRAWLILRARADRAPRAGNRRRVSTQESQQIRLVAIFTETSPSVAGTLLASTDVTIGASGFSLIETVISLGLIAGALIAVAQLFAISTESNRGSRTTTYAIVLAEQKLEELRALAYGYDAGGVPVTDLESDTARLPEAPSGGTGLDPSPATALSQNTPGYVDYLDEFGNKLGGGSQTPDGAVFARRWSIEPLPADPAHTIVIQVLVTRRGRMAAAFSAASTLPGDVRLVTVRTRKAR